MGFLRSVVTRERGALAGDACLLTAAAFGLVMGVLALAFAPVTSVPRPAGVEWVSLLSTVLSVGVMILGPLVSWRLHGRRLTWIAVLGAVLGGFLGSNLAGLLVMLVFAPLGWFASWVSGSEFAGLIVMVALVGAGFLALLVWLVVDGVRDLSASQRAHPRLDVLRLVSAAVLAVFAIVVAFWTAAHPGSESGEAIIFSMMAGLGAAMIVTGAEIATNLGARRKSGPAVSAS